jgi:hypothetical protein
MTDNKDQEFERELEKAIVEMLADDNTEPIEIRAAQWGREYGRNEEQTEFENLEGSLCPEDFGFEEYIRHLRTKVDRLKVENYNLRDALERARDEILGCAGHKDPTVVRDLTAIIDVQTLETENTKLRTALNKISSGAECSACSCSCHDMARKALGGEE